MEFKNSETRLNLMRAFAGESQARNRYTFAAAQARNAHLYVIERIFQYTAGQELEHAEIFYNFLRELSGQTLSVAGGYPVNIEDSTLELLRAAKHNEYEEYDPVYRTFGNIARTEGFPHIADTFERIAGIEKTHGDRFSMFADLLEHHTLFMSETPCEWVCQNCGYVHEGTEAPAVCPVCAHRQGYFLRESLTPFGIGH